jgi:hypothetical protein
MLSTQISTLKALSSKKMQQTKVIFERFPYRYVETGILEINGMPDYRIQKADSYTKRYRDMYLLDNQMQLLTAIEDFEYTKWLDPETVPCYIKEDTDGL